MRATVLLATYNEAQMTAIEVWTSNIDDKWNYSAGAALTAAETDEYNSCYSDISTYLSTEVVSFVTGARSLDTFDSFISDLESMGAKTCIDIKQAALDRYYDKALK